MSFCLCALRSAYGKAFRRSTLQTWRRIKTWRTSPLEDLKLERKHVTLSFRKQNYDKSFVQTLIASDQIISRTTRKMSRKLAVPLPHPLTELRNQMRKETATTKCYIKALSSQFAKGQRLNQLNHRGPVQAARPVEQSQRGEPTACGAEISSSQTALSQPEKTA
ncbi:hypothetical protein RRG08_043182 [Elysia crispata]|uniref:Uncharacterized protein n=1 Tax=Elysia crispata TaxID=231223 RepID=A0AAE0ZIU3_9GAST|nr:hypothetical protein RRG08_043182 [Elysia crispata]